ncbi:MAG TPA: hypothetical protein VD993_07390 [Chitinophagaceae bacterium]|nr:hypothetical protein [Chitinophagaceae bacterium]
MSDCNFSIPFPGPAADMVAKIRGEISTQGGNFNGDQTAGSFSIKILGSNIEGNYTISGQALNVVITDKPFFLGCGQIESFIKSRIGG